eukprot:15377007-Heterocapsa_arctica.AAC.1
MVRRMLSRIGFSKTMRWIFAASTMVCAFLRVRDTIAAATSPPPPPPLSRLRNALPTARAS